MKSVRLLLAGTRRQRPAWEALKRVEEDWAVKLMAGWGLPQ